MGFFEKLKQGLSKTASSISSVFTASELDDDFYDDLEESLIVSDLGMDTTETVMDRLRQTVREQHIKTVDEAKIALRAILADMLNVGDSGLRLDTKPSVILVIGVNGVGKTTTIGKLAHQLRDQGKKVLLCAGDTFRAAAAEQLGVWAQRAGVPMVRHQEGADPAAVVFDAVQSAAARWKPRMSSTASPCRSRASPRSSASASTSSPNSWASRRKTDITFQSLPSQGRWPGEAGTERSFQICDNLSVSLRLTASLPLLSLRDISP